MLSTAGPWGLTIRAGERFPRPRTSGSGPLRETLDIPTLVLGLIGGLVLFLDGIGRLTAGLRAIAGDRTRRILARFTTNRFAGVASGAGVTAMAQSSSATTITTVGLVDAGVLRLNGAIGVVMGANLGTTLSSQVFAFDIMRFGPLAMLAGLLLGWLGRSDWWREVGRTVLGLGSVFFALYLFGVFTRPLRDYRPFLDLMLRMENPILGVLAGAAITAVLQSSSAMMGMLIAMLGQGAITLEAAVPIMLGAEIGTCADTLVATIGRCREAVRVGLFHLLFNLASVALFLGLTGPLTQVAAWSAQDDPERQLANAHVLFNVASVLIFLGFTRTMARLLDRLIPEKAGASAAGPEPCPRLDAPGAPGPGPAPGPDRAATSPSSSRSTS